MSESSEHENIKDINESQFFEENNLYISGKIFKQSLTEINTEFVSFQSLFEKEEFQKLDIIKDLSIDDIKINSLEEDVENIIKSTLNTVADSKHKKLFVLKNDKENNEKKEKEEKSNINIQSNNINIISKEEDISNIDNSPNNKKKINYLRNEAKVLEETISKLDLTDYQTLKKEKFRECNLNSFVFFKNCKKEIGKENNYIFNYRDNFLNDMTKIDQLFFQDYFKPSSEIDKNKINLIYEFSIYHPIKNVKTQQISILGEGVLKQLKEKIYCVLDEIQGDSTPSFFFIEKVFYDDFIFENGKYMEPLSYKISQLKLEKMTLKEYQKEINYGINNDSNINNSELESKFFKYDKKLYCDTNSIFLNKSHSYESLNMNNIKIEDIPLRIGYPYIFRHIDSCDHVIILNDIRVMDKYDNFKERDEKAVVTYQKKLKRKKCEACNFYYAKFISINDLVKGNVNNALFLCDYCLKKLHETELVDNNTSNLKLIPYFHN
jgi:hypothetical protein